MTTFRGIPLGSDRATFEKFEQRVEGAALDAYLTEQEEAEAEAEREWEE